MENQNVNTETNLYANPAVPPATPKKSNGVVIGLIIAIVVLVLAICGVAGVAAYNLFANSPEARLTKGIAKWTETKEDKNTVSETLGWEEINDAMLYGATKKDLSLNVTFPLFEIPTIGIDMVDTCDFENQKDLSEWEVSVSNIELLKFRVAADAEKLYLAVPTLLKSTYHLGYENFKDNFNNSAWATMLEVTMEEDMELNPWTMNETAEGMEADQFFSEEFMADLEAKVAEMAKNITIEETDTVIEVTRGDKTVKCDGIYVVAPKDDLNELLDMIQEEMREGTYGQEAIAYLEANGVTDVQEAWDMIVSILDGRFTEDFQLMFYLDNKNNIVHMATPEMVVIDNEVAVGLSMDFVGEENPTDVVEGFYKIAFNDYQGVTFEFTVENEKEDTKAVTNLDAKVIVEEEGLEPEEVTVEYEYSWDSEDCEFTMNIGFESEQEELGFAMEGRFADIVKGESFTMELGKFMLDENGDTILKVTGDFEIAPLTEEVKIPSESVDLFGMTETDIQMLVFEIMGNADKMTDALNEFNF